MARVRGSSIGPGRSGGGSAYDERVSGGKLRRLWQHREVRVLTGLLLPFPLWLIISSLGGDPKWILVGPDIAILVVILLRFRRRSQRIRLITLEERSDLVALDDAPRGPAPGWIADYTDSNVRH
jgi:hypothetical protein